MARAIWSGSISFGLVNVPVKAFAAVRDHSVHFNQLEKGTGARIKYQKVSDKTGKEVSTDDIESGYELSSGKYVVVEDEELESLRPRTSRAIDVNDFVDLTEIDPIYYERTYWLAPDGETAERPYRLLLAAMESEGKAGIGTVVMRKKQYLAAIRPLDGALAMSTMRFADEVVPQSELELPKKAAKPEPKELKLAAQIIGSLATDWDPARYHDTYTEELKELIEAKAKGKKIVVEEEAPAEADVLDLMQALEASLEAARKGGGRKLPSEVAKQAEALAKEAEDDDEADDGKKSGSGSKAKAKAKAKPKSSSKGPATRSSSRKPAAKKSA
jgi:DNA end-binding protein Ku